MKDIIYRGKAKLIVWAKLVRRRDISSLRVWISIINLVHCLNSESSAKLKILKFSNKKHRVASWNQKMTKDNSLNIRAILGPCWIHQLKRKALTCRRYRSLLKYTELPSTIAMRVVATLKKWCLFRAPT